MTISLIPQGGGGGIRLVPADQPDPYALAASTIAPKGGAPYQLNVAADQALETTRRLKQMEDLGGVPQQPFGPGKSSLGADWGAAGSGFLPSNALSLGNAIIGGPSDFADLATYPARWARDNPATGPVVGRGSIAAQRMQHPEAAVNTPIFGYAPRPTLEGLGSQMGALNTGETPDVTAARLQASEAERRARYPVASGIGDVAGPIEAIALGRAPFSTPLRAHQARLAKEIEVAEEAKAAASKIKADKVEAAASITASPSWLKLRRLGERVGESSLEGAAQGILQRKDPIESAAYTGGAQAGLDITTGALLHNYAKGIPYAGKALSLSANLGILSGLLYVGNKVLPGSITDYGSKSAAAHKIIGSWLVGAGTAAVSGRARTGTASAYFPKFMDAVASAPRNTMQKYLIQYMGSDATGRAEFEQKVTSLRDRLPSMTEAQQRDLWAAFGRSYGAFKTEMDKVLGSGQ